jgi:hypothetical protein
MVVNLPLSTEPFEGRYSPAKTLKVLIYPFRYNLLTLFFRWDEYAMLHH